MVSKIRKLRTGEKVGGIPFTRGPLAYLLRNRFYIGEIHFKGEVLQGEQPAILDRDLFEAVQVKLSEQATNHTAARMQSSALLTGRIFDDRGNRMSPSHARKGNTKYRYYLSSAQIGRPPRARFKNGGEDSYWDCEFKTFQECVQARAGISFCNVNPSGPPAAAAPAPRGRR